MRFNDGTSVWFGWDGNSLVEELPSSGAPVRRVFADDGFTPLLERGLDDAWQLVLTDAVAAPWLYAAPDLRCSTIEMSTWGEVASRTGQPERLRCAGKRPRPWYNFWAPTAKQGDGSDFVIEGKQYITDKQGHLYYGTMSGTPSNPTVHGGDYVPTAPKR